MIETANKLISCAYSKSKDEVSALLNTKYELSLTEVRVAK